MAPLPRWFKAGVLFIVAAVVQGTIGQIAANSISDLVKSQHVRDIGVVVIWSLVIIAVLLSPLLLARMVGAPSIEPRATPKRSPGGPWRTFKVIEAIYGAQPHWENVTTVVVSQVANNRLDMLVGNDQLGCDPAPDRSKRLTIRYQVDEDERSGTWAEGEYVRIP